MKSQRDFRNYLAGGALAFGVVLLVSQILQLMYGGLSTADREPLLGLVVNVYLAAHLGGGFLGGYLVAKVRRTDYIQTGTVVAVLAYIFEFVYNIFVEATLTDIYAMLSLLIGGVVGAMFLRVRLERDRIEGLKKGEAPDPTAPEPKLATQD